MSKLRISGMRRALVFLPLLAGIYLSSIGVLCSSVITSPSLKGFNVLKPLLPPLPKLEVAIVADLDGTIYCLDPDSRKILWSFASGRPTYSSYQAFLEDEDGKSNVSDPNNDFYIDCDDDWALYLHSKSFGKVKLAFSAEEYVRNAPYVSEDGGVTLGTKKTTVFLVDFKSGKVVYTYKLNESPSTSGVRGAEENPVLSEEDAEELVESGALNLETVEQPLYIKRIDYVLQHYSPHNGKVLWNLAFAEFDAAFRYPKIESSYGGISPKTGKELSEEYGGDVDSQMLYQLAPVVFRIRDHRLTESLSVFDRLNDNSGGRPLPLPAPGHNSLSRVIDRLQLPPHENEGTQMLTLPTPENKNSVIMVVQDGDANESTISRKPAEIMSSSHTSYIISFLLALISIMGFVFYQYVAFGEQLNSNKHGEELKVQAGAPRKKRSRRLGSNKKLARETKGVVLTINDIVDGHVEGRRIGKLVVSNKEIAKGSNGTVVLEGIYDRRPVAVKRLVQTHHDVASKEIQNLIASDHHPNIVRWYGVEYDQDFVYLSLERCTCSLNDLIFSCSESFQSQVIMKDQDSNLNEFDVQLQSLKDIELWKKNGNPTPQLLKLMRDVVSGLAHLHELGIIHRDLKPQNVLIIKERSFCAKLSDMGISKRLSGGMSSLTQHATGCGSSGWQAPEILLHGRQTRAVDLFSLGCVLFFCVTGGKHPYGDSIERDVNIVNKRKDLFLVENIPEAVDLFSHLLHPIPDMRPRAMDVLHHPFFWDSEMRLSFLRDVSDRVELEDRENESELLNALESTAAAALKGKWDEKMETAFVNNIGRYRRYKYDSVRDLLRVIRNKLNHYRELPQEIQEILGPVPEGFDSYFSSRFPRLLIEVYNVMYMYCKEEEFFRKYINENLI
ncbi:serine/threonine-protein kinase/endoribonuclease IRE1b isoform X2 [Juglans microcarpa x Juglans regia]|uniref:serine/threonine-protein kinase/endoribonuclease IRE1b isoform X2 n=1 Tax=Juglans microcarpa x Juglans regia TaxID=2249226 RepID=UPI001B7DC5C9|nr:serine/threonine-protein kinase/endoribonuclease IRE1b isoform X2 [Juglans microcarpa x Juglans regia]